MKKNEKKKCARELDGLLPIFGAGSRYSGLYHDTAGHKCTWPNVTQPVAFYDMEKQHCDTASNGLRHGQPVRRGVRRERARPGHSVSRYKILYHGRGQPLCVVTQRPARHNIVPRCHNTAQRYYPTRNIVCDTTGREP